MSLYIQITDRCNMTCEHCCVSATRKGSMMTEEVFSKALKIAEKYCCMVTIGGGEPTLHPKCVEWTMRAAMATVDCSMDMDSPATLIVTNGSNTKVAIKLAKLAHLGVFAADLSQDPWHDPINYKVVEEFTRYNNPNKRFGMTGERKGYAGIRDVSDGVKSRGRAIENGLGKYDGCACDALFIAPNGDFYGCGCKKKKLGNILTDEIPAYVWDNISEGICDFDEKELVTT